LRHIGNGVVKDKRSSVLSRKGRIVAVAVPNGALIGSTGKVTVTTAIHRDHPVPLLTYSTVIIRTARCRYSNNQNHQYHPPIPPKTRRLHNNFPTDTTKH
jgi:hypothetical protein